MVFNSYIFVLLIFPLGIIGWHSIRRKSPTFAMLFIIGISLLFCGWYNYKYALVLLTSIVVNYLIGHFGTANEKVSERAKKVLLIVAIGLNVLTLVCFKYSSFFAESVNAVFKTNISVLKIIIPLGISFYTFSQISYQVDLYRREVTDHSFVEYCFYIVYFPKLTMGPIVRFQDFIQSVKSNISEPLDWDRFAYGIYMFSIGLAKKVLIADIFALAVNYGYGNIGSLNSIEAILTVLFYTIQIYFDFSGYSDMALGISKMLNIELPINFNMPYRALNIVDFWDRWHITLSKFFTRYLYIPLGGNRKGPFRTYLNVMIVFLISGLWHGANYTFILWGCLHGVFVVITKIFKKYVDKIPKAISWIITFVFICFSWILFRADSLADCSLIISKIFAFDFSGVGENILNCFELPEIFKIESLLKITSFSQYKYIAMVVFTAVALFTMIFMKGIETEERCVRFKPTIIKMLIASVLLVWSIVSFSGITTYIYQGF